MLCTTKSQKVGSNVCSKEGLGVKKSQQDSVYIALRSMLQTRVLSPETRQRIKTALRRVNDEAAQQTLRQVVFEDHGSAAAD